MLDVRQAVAALGGDLIGRDSILCPGPGHTAQDRSLSIKIVPEAPDGFVVFSHAGDDPIVCRDYVRTRLQLPPFAPGRDRAPLMPPSPIRVPTFNDDEREHVTWALGIWERCVSPVGTLAERYLKSRGLPLEPQMAGSVLRFHPSLKHGGGTAPALVALFRDINSNEPCGIHRTFLDKEGRKVGRKMLGRAGGAAIKLVENAEATVGLAAGEGLETTLSGRLAGFTPAWALGSADAIRAFPVLAGIESLTLFCETDANGANERAVKVCAERWLRAGREVFAVKPKGAGDLNDVLREVESE